MDSKAFIRGVQQKLDPIAPIVLPDIIKKQLTEVGATEDNLTPELAENFIQKMVDALGMFMGPDDAKKAQHIMIKELRRCAPQYFEDRALI